MSKIEYAESEDAALQIQNLSLKYMQLQTSAHLTYGISSKRSPQDRIPISGHPIARGALQG